MKLDNSHLIFFDFEVFIEDWLVVFSTESKEEVIVNDCEKLKQFISSHSDYYFIGFNNYHYDDIICHKILEGENPYKYNELIINGNNKSVDLKISDYLYKSLDLYQDLKRVSLKKIEANLGLSIIESPIDFKINRKLTNDELEVAINYCKSDVRATKYFFKYRKGYFETKLGIIKDFNLDEHCIRYTENQLATEILECNWYEKISDELTFDYCKDLNLDIIPYEILDFYGNIENDFTNCVEYQTLTKKYLKYNLIGCPTKYGFGGLHSALPNYTAHGNILQIDFSSFYPTIMINYNYFSRAITNPDKYKQIYKDRIALKKVDIEKSNRFKLILNKPYGCMKNRNHILSDFKNCNEITINGQLIITQLVLELEKYITLIQTNTDSITFKYESDNYQSIKNIINDFCRRFNLGYSETKISDIYQFDVNNYVIIEEETGKLKCKGKYLKKYDYKNNPDCYVNNSLSIIDKCLVNSLIYGKTVEETVQEAYDNDEIERFQLVVSYGKSFDKCVLEYKGEYLQQQKICRVFATKDKSYGEIYKHRDMSKDVNLDYEDEYVRVPNSFNHNYVFNDSLDKFDKTILDLDSYIALCKANMYVEEDD